MGTAKSDVCNTQSEACYKILMPQPPLIIQKVVLPVYSIQYVCHIKFIVPPRRFFQMGMGKSDICNRGGSVTSYPGYK